jgi:UDP-N-acetylmuramoyl-L-alanyl-D-glutamate--2,6-diaminopimelate ligase
MELGSLIDGLEMKLASPAAAGVRICDISEDSRTAVLGTLFVARAGTKSDGRAFIRDAVARGAVAVLTDDAALASRVDVPREVAVVIASDVALAAARVSERFYGNPTGRLKVAGVTGTNGKTTVSWLTWQLCNAAAQRTGLVGTVMIDDGVEVAAADMTTPPSIELSRTFARMAESGCVAAAIEASSHALAQQRVAAVRFEVAVFTNLTRDHLDYHKTMEAYADAKAKLFATLAPGALAVINAQDEWAPHMTVNCRARVLYCRVGPGHRVSEGDACAEIVSRSIGGQQLRLRGPWGEIDARVPLLGDYNAMNTLQAVATAHALGLDGAALASAMTKLSPPPGRLEPVQDPAERVNVFVDFAHTDDGLNSVLRSVKSVMTGERLWCVFGAGGDKDKGKRPRMGAAAVAHADRVVITSDNPRTERPSDIIDGILSGISDEQRHKVSVQPDRARAIRYAIEHADAGDVIVIAGKGHETTQIVSDGQGGTTSLDFDDRQVARDLLVERASPPPTHR